VIDLDELHEFLCSKMAHAQECYQKSADAKHLPPLDFKVGDEVFVKVKYFHSTCPSKKLSEKNLGPFPIIAQAGTHSFTLHLPDAMHSIHLIFHISQLEPSTPNTILNRIQPPPPLIEVDSEPEFKISEILDSKIDCCCKQCQLLYLVCWAGYEGTDEETSWLLATKLGNATELVQDFHSAYLDKPGLLHSN